jgi:hypothetical protein
MSPDASRATPRAISAGHRRWLGGLLAALGGLWGGLASAGAPTSATFVAPASGSPAPLERKALLARRASSAITLDGALTEPPWLASATGADFWQRSPREGQPPAFPTQFQVLYDDDALYIGVVAFDPEPRKIRRLLTRRDDPSHADWLEIGIDSYYDRRTAFVFAVNAAGVQRDHVVYDDAAADFGWDGVWSAATQVGAHGWTAEFRIPLNQIRYSSSDTQRWGLQVRRVVGRTQEETVWTRAPVSMPQQVGLYGDLAGLSNLKHSRHLELLPYAVGGVSVNPSADDATSGIGGAGLDARYALSSSFTLSGTLNPDFGQIDADPAVVNLSDKETFLVEKRPFFVEGTDAFRFSLATEDPSQVEELFYTRRIGSTPHGSAADREGFVSEADVATIYGAAKLSGKTEGGWSIGVLEAVTGEEHAVLADATGATREEVIEPLTNYAVIRLQREANRGRTRVGGSVTSVARRLEGTGIDFLHDRAFAGGLQLNHRLGRDRWMLEARTFGSWVHGSPTAIDETQRASQRYYQRPDAPHLDYDPTRTSLTGAGMIWTVAQDADERLRYGLQGDLRTPGLELNDLGYLVMADRISHQGWVEIRDDDPGELFLRYDTRTQLWALMDWEPRVRHYGAFVSANATMRDYWTVSAGLGSGRHRWDPGHLRGGPLIRRDPDWWGWLGLRTDYRRAVQASIDGQFSYVTASGSWSLQFAPGLTVQARSNLDLGVGLNVSFNVTDDQFIAAPTSTGGTPEYVLARLDQTSVGLTLRANYTVSPTLSLQLYAQPFTSVGAFGDYREVTSPRAHAYADRFRFFEASELVAGDGTLAADTDGDGIAEYSFDRPDFNFRQLRSNLVMRWEYRPGSTLFAVWAYNGSGGDDTGIFNLDEEIAGIGSAPAENVFLLKVNYWLGM